MGYTVEDLIDPQWIIQLGVAPVRIDYDSRQAGWEDRLRQDIGAAARSVAGSVEQ